MHYFFIIYLIYRLLGGSKGSGTGGAPSGRMVRGRHLWLLGLSLVYLAAGGLVAAGLGRVLDLPHSLADAFRLDFILAFVAAANVAPRWLAWRICGPRGWRRTGRACLALAVAGHRSIDRQGAGVLFGAVFDPAAPDLQERAANPWTAVAAVLAAERRGDLESAAELADGIEQLPPHALLSRSWRRFGIEIFALGAARRGDWREVERRVGLGQGRGIRFLRLLARAYCGERVSPWRLRIAWTLAPGRQESREWLAAALAGEREAPVWAAPTAAGQGTPWTRHLRLLNEAASGRLVPVAAVASLADSWGEALEARHEAAWIARGLVLGTRAPAEVLAGLRHRVLEEVSALLDSAEGEWPQEPAAPLLLDLLERRRDRLLAGLERWTAAFPRTGGITRPLRPPLEEWAEWVALRRHVQHLISCGGTEALETAWHSGLQLTACNWPFYLYQAHQQPAAWSSYVMHTWSSWLAAWVGDLETQTLSQSNAEILYQKAAE